MKVPLAGTCVKCVMLFCTVRRPLGESDILFVANSQVQGKLQEALVAVTQLGSVSFPRTETSNDDVAFDKAELNQLGVGVAP